MKLKTSILSVITLFALLFSSCGGSDGDSQTQYFFNGECKQKIVLEGAKDATITTAETSDSLDDMLKDSKGYGAPVTGGVLNPTETTSVKVLGLKEGVILKNFFLIINGQERYFNNITAENSNLYTMESLSYFNQAFNKMVSDRQLRTKVVFSPSERIQESDNVRVEIIFNGKFSYWR